ncbi:uncharacterized protein C1orf198 homolog [Chanos chanos]|uniref:Uncharacterized protein C1orf198 homolog n=1 Tax=Chanos chanos TaxID=29144 RepID=A0A6J2W0M6_CHACN|nr:uncharacterized protein C1orf198 homolog [Chanos chanos]
MAAAALAEPSADRMMEAKKFEYFSSINSMARKIMQEREKVKEKHGSSWDKMTPNEQDIAIDNAMMDPQIRARYAMHRVDRDEVICYPKLLIQTGQKIVHFGEEDITWQDEHSAPFSWETKSQMDFSLTSGASEQGVSSSLSDSKPTKTSQGPQLSKGTPGPKASAGDSAVRREEESSFWKISAERSRLEGEKSEFQSLTPSQIKSMEKGEKPLPSYLRQESGPEEHPRPVKQRLSKPHAPPPPVPVTITPVAISGTPAAAPAAVSVSSSVAGWERSQSTLPSVSPVDDLFSPELSSRSPAGMVTSPKDEKTERPETSPVSNPTFLQFNTSNSILKTGFDFLDNW